MHEIHITGKKLIHVFLRSLLLCKTTCNCTYLYTEDIINTILFTMHHKIPLHVPFIIFFEKSSRSHSGGLEICIQSCIVLYSYKKNNSMFLTEHGCSWSHYCAQYYRDQAFQTTLNISCFSLLNTEQNENTFSCVFQSSQTGLGLDLQGAH